MRIFPFFQGPVSVFQGCSGRLEGKSYANIQQTTCYIKPPSVLFQNSIRHNLSLNPAFRKVKDSMRWQGKKGYYWEVVPERWASVEREVERYLRQEGKLKDMDITDGSRPDTLIFIGEQMYVCM